MASTERVSQRWDAAQRACRDGNLETLRWLIEHAQLFQRRQALRAACISGAWGSGREDVLKDPFSTTDSIRLHTLLQTATTRGHAKVVRYLLQQFPVKDLHVLEWEIVLSAIGRGSVDLLEAFAAVDPEFVHMSRPEFGNCFTALFSLVKEPEDHLPVVQFLLARGALPDDGASPFHTLRAAVASSTPEVIQTLKQHGANGEELQMLAVAAETGNITVVKYLLDMGAEVDQMTQSDEASAISVSALAVAERNGHHETAELLRSHGADSEL